MELKCSLRTLIKGTGGGWREVSGWVLTSNSVGGLQGGSCISSKQFTEVTS